MFFHLDLLQILAGSEKVYKGVHSSIESYSSFYDNAKRAETQLRSVLKDKQVTDVYVCGLALDVCVGESHCFFPIEIVIFT